MISLSRTTAIRLLLLAAMTAVVGCRDQLEPTGPAKTWSLRSSATISDGAHNQGNDDVFFLPPMVPNPVGVAGYGDPFQPALPVSVKICIVPSADPCTSFIKVFGPDVVKASSEGFYAVNWDTKAVSLDPTKTYRIEVWVRNTRIAFADVDVVSSGSQLKNVNTNEFIPLLDGRTLPIKVRIEEGWNCQNNGSCATQEVTNVPPAGQLFTQVKSKDGEMVLAFPADWHAGDFPVLVTVEDKTEELRLPNGSSGCGLGLTKMLSAGTCIKVTLDPPVIVAAGKTVIVAMCQEDLADTRQRFIKYDVGEPPKFLRNVPVPTGFICPENHQIGSTQSSNPLVRFASAAYSRMAAGVDWLIGARTAYAIDAGVGGALDSGDGFSLIAAGIPATMLAEAGMNQSGPVGSVLPVAPKVKLVPLHPSSGSAPDFPPAPLVGFDVTCQVTGGGGSLIVGESSVQSATVQTDAQGFAQCPSWELGDTPGQNTLQVSAARLDAVVRMAELGEEGPEEDDFPGTVTFTAEGTTSPQFNGSLSADFGSAVVDGTISAGEWNLANCRSFTVNTPHGGTVPGTVCAKNDITNLYLAVFFNHTEPGNTAAFEFDKDGNGTGSAGDDGIILNPGGGANNFNDLVRWLGEGCPVGPCSARDVDRDGTTNGSGAFAVHGTQTVYEFSHPLNSGDPLDIAVSPGATIGVNLFVRLIEAGGTFPDGFGDTTLPGPSISNFTPLTLAIPPIG